MTTDNESPSSLLEGISERQKGETIRRLTGWLGLAILIGLALVFAYGDKLPLNPQMTIVSGKSMEPTMHTGDLLLTRSREHYSVGEQVVYRVPEDQPGEGSSVVHRVVGNDDDGYLMQGDNNSFRDPWRPSDQDIVGTRLLLIPKLGWLLAYLSQPVILGALLGGLVTTSMIMSSLSSNDERDDVAPEQADPQEIDLRVPEHHDARSTADTDPERKPTTAAIQDFSGSAQPEPEIDLRSKPEIDFRSGPVSESPVAPGVDETDRAKSLGSQFDQPKDGHDLGGGTGE